MRVHGLLWSAAALLAVNVLVGTHHGGMLVRAEEITEEKTTTTPETQNEYVPPKGSESFKFEAEVHRMLDIVVNSLYQNKDVFLRELISNASDALDKIRFLALTKPKLLEDVTDLEVRIEYDSDAHTLTVRDTGVGMTHEELVENLGTVARSGTTKFLEAITSSESKQDVSGMIGQFGVGFYSSFLVADRVTVASKSPEDDTQYIWESVNGNDEFVVYKDPRGNTLKRGTEITLHLKEDCLEYADPNRLKNLVTHYSEFITHPIHLRITRTEIVEIEDDEDKTEDKEEKKQDDKDEFEMTEDDDEKEEEKPKLTKEVTTHEWEEINSTPAIWTREKEDISDDEYQTFWKVLAKEEYTNATAWSHFNAEGNINFRSIIYLPGEVPSHYRTGNIDAVPGGLKLYVRKVLISDEFELMPRYLGFIRGVIDSEDLPLNVNRETLQESKIIQVIKKKLVRKALEMIKTFSKAEAKREAGDDSEEDADVKEKDTPYLGWYKKFAVNLKMGLIDDEPNRNRIVKLLRFQTSKSDSKWITLDEYIENMKEWQTDIFFLAGMSLSEVKKSRFLDQFKEKDVEVVYLTDPVDEYVVQHMRDYDGKKFVAISSESVKLKDEDESLAKRREKFYTKQFKPLTKWLKKLYGQSVMRVSISKRLGSTPAIVSSSQFGHSANMERIMRAQAFQAGVEENPMMRSMKVFEINPRHPLVIKLLEGCPPEKEDEDAEPFVVSQEVEDAAMLLHDLAMLNGGFQLEDAEAHTKRMMRYLQSQLAVDSMELAPEVDPPEEEEKPPELDLDGLDGMNMADFDLDGLDGMNMDDFNLDDIKVEL